LVAWHVRVKKNFQFRETKNQEKLNHECFAAFFFFVVVAFPYGLSTGEWGFAEDLKAGLIN
jgi:hypothetical protein